MNACQTTTSALCAGVLAEGLALVGSLFSEVYYLHSSCLIHKQLRLIPPVETLQRVKRFSIGVPRHAVAWEGVWNGRTSTFWSG